MDLHISLMDPEGKILVTENVPVICKVLAYSIYLNDNFGFILFIGNTMGTTKLL